MGERGQGCKPEDGVAKKAFALSPCEMGSLFSSPMRRLDPVPRHRGTKVGFSRHDKDIKHNAA